MNDETVEQAIRRHERWLGEQENAIQLHTGAIRRHEETVQKHDEWLEEFWAAMKAATERADRTDRRLDRFERQGTRRLVALDARIAALADNQATIQAALQALTAQIDRFLRGQQHDGHE